MDLLGALGYAADSIDKPGRAVRGLLAGKADEGLAAIPFSDSLGITDPRRATSGRDLADSYGITRKGDKSFGSHAIGFGAGMVTDPLSYLGVGAAAKGAKTFGQGAGAAAKSVTGLDLLDSLRSGGKSLYHAAKSGLGDSTAGLWNDLASAGRGPTTGMGVGGHPGLGLKYDGLASPPPGLARSDPEWVNNRTWFHGSDSADLTGPSIDPLKTAAGNQLGRGLYMADAPDIATSYADAARLRGVDSASAYRAQTAFGKIMDLRLKPHQDPGAVDLLESIGREHGLDPSRLAELRRDMLDPEFGSIRDLYRGVVPAAQRAGGPGFDPIIAGLKRGGYDALVSPYSASSAREMLVALDPNDAMKLGRSTPFRHWERMKG